MECNDLRKILNKYNIIDINTLEDALNIYTQDCDDTHEDEMKNVCLEKKCFESGVPPCRRLIEIHKKFYKDKYKGKNDFAVYLVQKTKSSESSILNWLSCKQCKTNDFGLITGNIDHDFMQDFIQDICKNLDIKLDVVDVFKKKYKSVDVFITNLLELTEESYVAKLDKLKKKNSMKKIEKDELFAIVHVSKEELKKALSNIKELVEGRSDEFKLNLALEAFDRRLDNEALNIVNMLKNSDEFKNDSVYLQLKAKLLSNTKNDKEAIEVLNKLKDILHPNIDVETYNLLAASIKRDAFKEFNLDHIEENLIEKLIESKAIYQKIFDLTKDYYPAINIVYIEMILAYIEALDSEAMKEKDNDLKQFWANVRLDKKDYWSYISNIEFLILTKQYEVAKDQIEYMFKVLDEDEISEFMSFSTNRQMEMYRYFCTDDKLDEFISRLKNLKKTSID